MIRKKIQDLEAAQIALLKVMAESDAHASKCVKLGKDFKETYPEDYARYTEAREKYNSNEQKIGELKEELAKIPPVKPIDLEK